MRVLRVLYSNPNIKGQLKSITNTELIHLKIINRIFTPLMKIIIYPIFSTYCKPSPREYLYFKNNFLNITYFIIKNNVISWSPNASSSCQPHHPHSILWNPTFQNWFQLQEMTNILLQVVCLLGASFESFSILPLQ